MGKLSSNALSQYDGEIYLNKEEDALHFPVLFLYDEYHQSDWIRDFSENHTFLDHLSYMFPSNNSISEEIPFASWDSEHKYKLEDLEIYVEVGVTEPFKNTSPSKNCKRKWIKVRSTTTLKTVLTHPNYVVPQFPSFHIVVPGPFKDQFLIIQ